MRRRWSLTVTPNAFHTLHYKCTSKKVTVCLMTTCGVFLFFFFLLKETAFQDIWYLNVLQSFKSIRSHFKGSHSESFGRGKSTTCCVTFLCQDAVCSAIWTQQRQHRFCSPSKTLPQKPPTPTWTTYSHRPIKITTRHFLTQMVWHTHVPLIRSHILKVMMIVTTGENRSNQ